MRLAAFLVSSLTFLCAPRTTHADRAEAARLFEAGDRYARRGDHVGAAERFEQAHAASPATVALIAAAHERMLAAQWDRVTEHVRALEPLREDEEVARFLEVVVPRLLRVRAHVLVRCEPSCKVALNAHPPTAEAAHRHALWLAPDRETTLWVRFASGLLLERRIDLPAGEHTLDITAPAPRVRETEVTTTLPDAPPTVDTPSVVPDAPAPRRRLRAGVAVALASTTLLDGVALFMVGRAVQARRAYAASPDIAGFERAMVEQRAATGVGVCALLATAGTASALVVTQARDRARVRIELATTGRDLVVRGTF